MISPRECRKQSFYWLLSTSVCGLVNANGKWKEHCDHLFSSLWLTQSRFMLQFFCRRINENLQSTAVRIVDEVLRAGENSIVQGLINIMKEQYKLGVVVNGAAAFLFFDLHIIQDSEMNVTVHGGSKLNATGCPKKMNGK